MSKIVGISFIAPVKHLAAAEQYSDFSMVLTHLVLSNQVYRDFYRASKKPILLDNSYFELGRCLSKEEVVEAAKAVAADCVVLTDGELKDMDYFKSKGFEVMFVPMSFDDLKYALRNSASINGIDKVGISCLNSQAFIGKESFEPCRAELLLKVNNLCKIATPKRIHFLGATNAQLKDLKAVVDAKLIGSIDTSLPVWAGLNGITLSANSARLKEHCDFESSLEWTPEVSANILAYKQCFNYGLLQTDFQSFNVM